MNSIHFNGKILDFGTPRVMGILNCTPDSFFDGGKFFSRSVALKHAEKMLTEGAEIIDVGGMSSRPGAEPVSSNEEIGRIEPVIDALRREFPGIFISVDTFRTEVAEIALDAGADIVNDISGGELDKRMFSFIAERKVPYILMHMQGTPGNMQLDPAYDQVVSEIFHYFVNKIRQLKSFGIEEVVIDPGFGFGKTIVHNFEILNQLEVFSILEKPVLAGLSRKSMLYKTIGHGPEEALSATASVHMVALQKGASILRVHDVKEAKDVVRIFSAMKSACK
ncbi:MAG TPA: dihydropteroate synthase [Saprospirales bacterium]|nr:dihydropteroate synthase [Saprospirales bacterium]HAY70839.1 dihydropteroate synthase [Saprospirales bacterium]HRQ30208.1 dihydropteroate synthase [Saprospiraceae bacterium]